MLSVSEEWLVIYRRVRPFWMTEAAWKLKSSEWTARFTSFKEAYAFASVSTERRSVDVERFQSSRGAQISRSEWEQMYREMLSWEEAYASVTGREANTSAPG